MRSHDAPDDPPPAFSELGLDLAALEDQLRLALALKQHLPLRLAALRGSSAREMPLSFGWGVARLEDRDLTITHGAPPEQISSSPAFATLASEPAVATEFARIRASGRIDEAAAQLVRGLLFEDRSTFRRLLEWSPMIESAVYGIATRIAAALDGMREGVQAACAKERSDAGTLAVSYQAMVNALGRCTLLATDAGSPWLTELALSFAWESWTPSFPLIRERTLWSTLIGARAAAAFGPACIDRYLEALAHARHPVLAIDALVGLSAIGLRHATERSWILDELEREMVRSHGPHSDPSDVVVLAFVQARRLLSGTVASRALGSADRWRDGFETDLYGQLKVFELLPSGLTVPSWTFSTAGRDNKPFTSAAATKIFRRAWGIGRVEPATDPSWSAGRA